MLLQTSHVTHERSTHIARNRLKTPSDNSSAGDESSTAMHRPNRPQFIDSTTRPQQKNVDRWWWYVSAVGFGIDTISLLLSFLDRFTVLTRLSSHTHQMKFLQTPIGLVVVVQCIVDLARWPEATLDSQSAAEGGHARARDSLLLLFNVVHSRRARRSSKCPAQQRTPLVSRVRFLLPDSRIRNEVCRQGGDLPQKPSF